MKKKYRKIEFMPGQNIESAIKELYKHKDLVCGSFNGKPLYSDVDDLDSAFKKITGKTKSEFDKAMQERQLEYERGKREHEKAIPRLTQEWIEKGKKILDSKHHDLWIKIVPVRLKDIYRGFELGACLDIVEQLNNNCKLEEAKAIIEEQGHSGMSFGLVCSMIKEFSDRGDEFVKYVR